MTVQLDPPEREMNIEQVIARGREADSLLNGELATEVRNEARLRLIEAWATTAPDDVAGREKLHATYIGIEVFDGVLREIINDAHHAEQVREEREKALTGEQAAG